MKRNRRGERGQAMVELGITIVLFMMLSLGIIEFGRVLMISNMITHAARHGARAAAVTPPSGRDPTTGMFTNGTKSNVQTAVRGQLQNVVGTAASNTFGVNVTQPTVSSMNMVRIQVTGTIPYLFSPFLFRTSGSPLGLTIDRSVYFRDEGR